MAKQQIPVWDTSANAGKGGYIWPALGSTLAINNSLIDITAAPSTTATAKRRYDVMLFYSDNTKAWVIPSAAPRNVVVYCNGLRYRIGTDYTLMINQVIPVSTVNWRPDALVVADFEE